MKRAACFLAFAAALAAEPSRLEARPKSPERKPSVPAAPAAVEASTPTIRLATAPPRNVAEVIALFQSIDESMTGLSASFVQSVSMESGIAQTVEGTVEYLKPGRLRLEHQKPERQTVVSDGKVIWIHRHDRNQVIQSSLEEWRKADPAGGRLLDFGGYSRLLESYEVSYSTAAREVTLRPKDAKQEFTLRLRLNGPGFFPTETELDFPHAGIRSTLSGLRFNPAIEPSRFQFTPPAGADVFRDFKPPALSGEPPR